MTRFFYTAVSKNGAPQKGNIEATNEQIAETILRERGLIPISLKSPLKIRGLISKKVSLEEKTTFNRQLATMINAGFSIVEALESLIEQIKSPYLKEVTKNLVAGIRGGKSFSEILSQYPDVFDPVYISLIQSGEATGKLDEVLLRLADQMEKTLKLRSFIKSALYYPVFILISIAMVGVIAIVYILPQLESLFKESGVKLPLLTSILISIGNGLKQYWLYIILILVFIWFALKALNRNPKAKKRIDAFKIRIPILGNILKKLYMARFCRTLGIAVASGVPILDSLEITSNVIGNTIFQETIKNLIKKKVESGIPLNEALKDEKDFPLIVFQMTRVGEKTGTLDEMLLKAADLFDNDIDQISRSLSSLLEPVLIVFMGIAVGLLAYSILIPIWDLTKIK